MVIQINYCEYCNKELQITNKQRLNQKHCNYECKKNHTIKKNKKNCLECNSEFISKYANSIYCTSECYNKYQTREKQKPLIVCLNCNKEFKKRSGSSDSNTYCGHKCYQEYCDKRNRLKKIEPKPIKAFSILKETNCIECNKIILSKRSKKICSKECETTRNYRKFINKAKEDIRECKLCKKEYNRYESGVRSFCSIECRDKQKKILKKKIKSPNKHRKRAKYFNVEYDSNASLVWLRKEYNNNCAICNKKVLKANVSGYHDDNGTVGHIVALSQNGNHTKENIQLECGKCNQNKGIKTFGQLRMIL